MVYQHGAMDCSMTVDLSSVIKPPKGIVLGTAQLGLDYGIANQTGSPGKKRAQSVVAAAWRAGVTYFDTAQSYGNSEENLGSAIKEMELESQAQVITKLDAHHTGSSKEEVYSSILASRSRLRVDSLWGLMLHNANMLSSWKGQMRQGCKKAQQEGVVKRIGVSVYTVEVFQLLLRVMNGVDAQDWLKVLVKQKGLLRSVLIGTGITGDPIYISTLLRHMSIPEFARVAGEAFCLITGLNLESNGLITDSPENFEAGPTENPEDEDVAMDPDEHLPWPDAEMVKNWWEKNQNLFQAGARYLLGKPISQNHCVEVLKTAGQRQRVAASFEMALMQPSTPLFQIIAPAARQKAWLQVNE